MIPLLPSLLLMLSVITVCVGTMLDVFDPVDLSVKQLWVILALAAFFWNVAVARKFRVWSSHTRGLYLASYIVFALGASYFRFIKK